MSVPEGVAIGKVLFVGVLDEKTFEVVIAPASIEALRACGALLYQEVILTPSTPMAGEEEGRIR